VATNSSEGQLLSSSRYGGSMFLVDDCLLGHDTTLLIINIYWHCRWICSFHPSCGDSGFLWSIHKYLSDCFGSHWEDTYILHYHCENRISHTAPSCNTEVSLCHCRNIKFCLPCFLTGSSICTIPCNCYLSGFSNNGAYWQHPSDSSNWRHHGYWRNPH